MKFVFYRYRPESTFDQNINEVETRPHEYTPIFGVSNKEKWWQSLLTPSAAEANEKSAKIVNIFTISSGFKYFLYNR